MPATGVGDDLFLKRLDFYLDSRYATEKIRSDPLSHLVQKCVSASSMTMFAYLVEFQFPDSNCALTKVDRLTSTLTLNTYM